MNYPLLWKEILKTSDMPMPMEFPMMVQLLRKHAANIKDRDWEILDAKISSKKRATIALTEIAAKYDLSESRVSTIVTQSLRRLRELRRFFRLKWSSVWMALSVKEMPNRFADHFVDYVNHRVKHEEISIGILAFLTQYADHHSSNKTPLHLIGKTNYHQTMYVNAIQTYLKEMVRYWYNDSQYKQEMLKRLERNLLDAIANVNLAADLTAKGTYWRWNINYVALYRYMWDTYRTDDDPEEPPKINMLNFVKWIDDVVDSEALGWSKLAGRILSYRFPIDGKIIGYKTIAMLTNLKNEGNVRYIIGKVCYTMMRCHILWTRGDSYFFSERKKARENPNFDELEWVKSRGYADSCYNINLFSVIDGMPTRLYTALRQHGIVNYHQLESYTETMTLGIIGIGPIMFSILKDILSRKGIDLAIEAPDIKEETT